MMNSIMQYLTTEDAYYRQIMISGWQHMIGRESKAFCDQTFAEAPADPDKLSEEEMIRLCIAATYIEYAYALRFKEVPAWVRDKRLYLKKPYLGRGYTEIWLFEAPQPCLNHNVFIEPGSLDVL